MRVLVIRDGRSRRSADQAAALQAARPDVELALAQSGGLPVGPFSATYRLGERPARDLREAIAAFLPDVIHSYGPSPRLTVTAIELSAGRIPVIWDLPHLRDDAADDELTGRAARECDALVAPSQELLDSLAEFHLLPPVTCVFPDYRGGGDDSIESNIGPMTSLYERLTREPLAGIAAEFRRS